MSSRNLISISFFWGLLRGKRLASVTAILTQHGRLLVARVAIFLVTLAKQYAKPLGIGAIALLVHLQILLRSPGSNNPLLLDRSQFESHWKQAIIVEKV